MRRFGRTETWINERGEKAILWTIYESLSDADWQGGLRVAAFLRHADSWAFVALLDPPVPPAVPLASEPWPLCEHDLALGACPKCDLPAIPAPEPVEKLIADYAATINSDPDGVHAAPEPPTPLQKCNNRDCDEMTDKLRCEKHRYREVTTLPAPTPEIPEEVRLILIAAGYPELLARVQAAEAQLRVAHEELREAYQVMKTEVARRRAEADEIAGLQRDLTETRAQIHATDKRVKAMEAERDALKAEIHEWRQFAWLIHGHPFAALYGDDGEMQCNVFPPADFKRGDVAGLIEHSRKTIQQINAEQHAKVDALKAEVEKVTDTLDYFRGKARDYYGGLCEAIREPRISDSEMMALLRRVNREFEERAEQAERERDALKAEVEHKHSMLERDLAEAREALYEVTLGGAARVCDTPGCSTAIIRRDSGARVCAAGHPERWVDVSALRQAERERDAAQNRFEAMAENNVDLGCSRDAAFDLLRAMRAAQVSAGVTGPQEYLDWTAKVDALLAPAGEEPKP